MAFVGPGNYDLVVLHVGGSKATYIKLFLERQSRTSKTWFLAGSILPNEELVDAAIRELLEEIGFTLTPNDLALLSNNPVRGSLPNGKHHSCLRLLCIGSGTFCDS
jgi:8-oxo-dGTP pyrophosphatase MutT (NUDIX family)